MSERSERGRPARCASNHEGRTVEAQRQLSVAQPGPLRQQHEGRTVSEANDADVDHHRSGRHRVCPGAGAVTPGSPHRSTSTRHRPRQAPGRRSTPAPSCGSATRPSRASTSAGRAPSTGRTGPTTSAPRTSSGSSSTTRWASWSSPPRRTGPLGPRGASCGSSSTFPFEVLTTDDIAEPAIRGWTLGLYGPPHPPRRSRLLEVRRDGNLTGGDLLARRRLRLGPTAVVPQPPARRRGRGRSCSSSTPRWPTSSTG